MNKHDSNVFVIHYMTKSMWRPARRTSHWNGVGPPLAAITASPSSGCWNIAAGNCFHSATRALVRSGTDVGRLGLARSQRSNSSQMCLIGLRAGLCAGQSSSFTQISTNHFCMNLTLCSGALSCWNRKGSSPNCCHKIGRTELSRMSLYAVVLRLPFTGTKAPIPNHEKQRNRHLWDELEHRLRGRTNRPTSVPDLTNALVAEWNQVPAAIF